MSNIFSKENALKMVSQYKERKGISTFQEAVKCMRQDYANITTLERIALYRVEMEMESYLQ